LVPLVPKGARPSKKHTQKKSEETAREEKGGKGEKKTGWREMEGNHDQGVNKEEKSVGAKHDCS